MPSLEKAIITNTVTRERVAVMFNPEQYTLSRDVNYAQHAVPGLSAQITQFVSGNLQTLEMELLVDTVEEHRHGSRVLNRTGDDVRKLTGKLAALMDVDPTTHAPPVLVFTWGESLTFTCVLARMSQSFIMFRPDGSPVRARLQVTFNEFRNRELEAKEVKRETADYTKTYQVRQGESLAGIAWKVYGKPGLWRPIAIHNDIRDPGSLEPGQRLSIPRLPYRDPASGVAYR